MADFVYNTGSGELLDGDIDFLTDALIKAMLVATGYVEDRDDDFVDEAGANDPIDEEISGGSGYTGGFGGSGRKALASKAITVNKGSDRVELDCADIVWSAIDTTTEPASLCIIRELTNDTLTHLLTHHDFVAVTNGGDLTAQIADFARLSTV